MQEELQDESFRRTFVGFTQAACQNTKKIHQYQKIPAKKYINHQNMLSLSPFFQFSCETFNKNCHIINTIFETGYFF